MLSVITITFNNYEELLATCNSLKGLQGIEHIVVNGGQCPETLDFLKNSSNIKSISEKDRGISDAFNKGLALANGSYMAFLNSGDVLIDPSYYAKASSHLIYDKSIDFIHSKLLYVDQYAGEVILSPVNRLPDMPFWHPTMIVKKEVFDVVGKFRLDLKSGMDLDFVYRMLSNNMSGLFLDTVSVRMDGRGVSSVRPWLSFSEKIKVVILNKDYRFVTWLKLTVSFFKLSFRELLVMLGCVSILRKVKSNIFKIKYSRKPKN
jgi:glycosyltransferase involved in cell wall biosynthesis